MTATITPTFTVTEEFVKDIINIAITHRKQVKIAYLDKKGNAENRIIEPFETTNDKNFGGFCTLRGAYRNFSFNRVIRIVLTDFDHTTEPPEKKAQA